MVKSLVWTLLALATLLPSAVAVSRDSHLLRGSSRSRDPELKPWTPPPAYAIGTFGHKTMYLTDVAIGSAGQQFRLLVDTGSPLLIVPGAACQKRSRRFDTSAAKPGNRTVSVKFGLGAVSGHIFEDRVCVQTPNGAARLEEVGFLQERTASERDAAGQACAEASFLVMDEESDDLAEQPFDGILGLGLESSSELRGGMGGGAFSVLGQLAADGAVPSTAFALRLSNSGASQLLLGGVDESTFAGGRAVWVPLSPAEDGYWQFSAQDLTLEGRAQNFGGLQVGVDSGTSLLSADQELGEWLRKHLSPQSCDEVDHLPKLGLKVHGGSILSLLPADYIDQSDGECKLALMPSPMQSVSGQRLMLGDSFLRRYVTVFDRQSHRLGFGVAADDGLGKVLLPDMFPEPTTTAALQTTLGPPPPKDLDYGESLFAPPTTQAPPSPEEIEKARQEADVTNAFSGMGDDLAGSFEQSIAKEKATLGTKWAGAGERAAGLEAGKSEKLPASDGAPGGPTVDSASAIPTTVG